MAEGTKLGDFYFDVRFEDQTKGILQNIKDALNKIDRDIEVKISGKVGGNVADIQKSINEKLKSIKASVPVLLNNEAITQIQNLANTLKGVTVEIQTVLKNPTPQNINNVKRSVKGAIAEINVALKDISDAKIKAMQNSIQRRLKPEVKVNATTARSSLQDALKKRPFKFDVVVDQMKVAQAVQAALKQAGLNQGVGLTAAQARAQRVMQQEAESQARIARQDAANIAKQTRAAELHSQEMQRAAARTKTAQAQMTAAQERATAATNRNTMANQRNAQSYMLINKSLTQTIPLTGSLMNMARNYIGVFGAVSALRSLYDTRAEFERQAVALKALMQSASQARQVMGELQQMALKSPFAVADIIGFSKQLSAYSISNNELVDTTKRLADLSAGLGVDMSRLILAYGQVKAATVLRGQELRQFTEAGIPMVRALADEFTKMEGRVVTAADVFERISKKAVSFEMVKKVLDSMTSEGGRFYEHQAKMVETLYGKIERMGDAYKVMMNQFGESNDALLKAPIDAITHAIMDWRSTIRSIVSILAASGMWKFVNYLKTAPAGFGNLNQLKDITLQQKQQQAINMLYSRGGLDKVNQSMQRYIMNSNTMTKADWARLAVQKKLTKSETMYLYVTGRLTKEQVTQIAKQRQWNLAQQQTILNMNKIQLYGMRAGNAIVRLGAAFKSFAMQAWPVAALTFLVDMIARVMQAKQEIEDFNKTFRDSAKDVYDDLHDYLESHKEAFKLILDPTVQQDEETLRKAWEDIKSKIEEMPNQEFALAIITADADGDLKKLTANAIRLQLALERVSDELHNLDATLEVTQDTLGIGIFGEGVKSDIKDFEDELKNAKSIIEQTNEFLRKNKIDFEITRLNFDDAGIRQMEQAAKNAGVNPKWYVNQLTRVYDDLDAANKEAADEIRKSLMQSLVPAFEELREKGIKTPKEMAAVYAQKMPEIKEMMGATTKEMSEMVDRIALEVLSKQGFQLDQAVLLATQYASDLRTRVTSEAQNMGADINEIIESGNTKLMSALLKAAIENNDTITKETEAQFNALRSYIESHPAIFKVFMRVETQEDGEARRYLKGLTGAKNSFALAKMYGASAPEGGDTNDKAIKRAKDNREKAIDDQETTNRQLNNLVAAGKKNTEQYQKLQDTLEGQKTAAEQATRAYLDLGGDPSELEAKGGKKGGAGRKTGGGSKRDTWLDNIKNRISEFKEAQSEIEKLRKMGVSQAEAIDKVMSMSWTYGLDKAKLGRGGTKKMVDALIPLIEEHGKGLKGAFKQANDKLLLDLQKMAHDEQLKQYEEEAKKIGDEIRNRIETGVKNWKLYDTLFEATGDEAMSANAAFGGTKLFKNLEEQLIAIFNENTSGISFEDAVKMDETSLREVMTNGEAYIDLLKRIKDVRESGWNDIMTAAAKAIEEQMSLEERIQKQRIQNQKELEEFIERNGGGLAVANNPVLQKMFDALKQKGIDAIDALKAESFELSDVWEKIFSDLTFKSYGQIKAIKRISKEIINSVKVNTRDKNGKPKTYIAEYIDDKGVKKKVTLTSQQLQKLKGHIDELDKSLMKKNPFRAFKDNLDEIIKKMREGEEVTPELWAQFLESGAEAIDMVSELTTKMSAMFKALGNKELAKDFEIAAKGMNSISNIFKGFAQNGKAGGIMAFLGEVVDWITYIAEESQRSLEELLKIKNAIVQNAASSYEVVFSRIRRELGGIYAEYTKLKDEYSKWRNDDARDRGDGTTGSAYGDMLARLKDQQKKTNEAYEAYMRDSKDTDMETVNDYRKQLQELDDQIKHFAEDMAKELYDIDVKSWAKELTDAIVSAWQNGENAAEAYKDKVREIIADVTKNVISQKIMEMALTPVLDSIVDEMTAKNGMLDEESLLRFANELGVAGTGAVNTITGLLEKMKELGYDLTDITTGTGTLGEGIKSITEDQANLLASYLNAMRADLSVVRLMWEQHAQGTSVVSQAQLTQLNAIAANTLRNAESAERIENALNSVITVGASGSRIRV